IKYMRNSDGVMDSEYFPNLVKRVRAIKENQKGGKVMCEIIDKIVAEEVEKALKEVKKSVERDTEKAEKRGEKRGEARGMVITLKMLNYQTEDIVVQLINNFHLTEEEAVKYL
ncbi:MAG: hypothetical protein R3Y40_02560, partial [Eubacteriales bacterium]